MRPGFQGKWIEFITHDADLSTEQIIDKMLERQHKVKYSVFLEQEIAKNERILKTRQKIQ